MIGRDEPKSYQRENYFLGRNRMFKTRKRGGYLQLVYTY